ncbi:GntR family transcriptional regulator/MocR family aminotransferase [Allocatelliglobosispora scoriae]|uniref:GntR family transcriptional regulator/MocR family aminotransferase n=1 Tax=Allocatelliglobosispora scoriae TaxID=643052 RepID=A0A841BN86_9ACTN|nr:PLP-dependent aminotransferase family protein [Allocatelliglobosispora scoriae]MBB5868746.1 GntR family transcriptional regulator/MocR family aminotransferase [Allocatelliglobosispora scoriae]
MSSAKSGQADRSISAGSDFLQLNVADAPAGHLSDWLAERLRLAISDGRIPLGGQLPASRILAAELGVSRGVVTEAYQRLIDDGHAAGRGRAGTVIVAAPVSTVVSDARATLPPAAELFAATPRDDIFDALREAPVPFDLTPGMPDLAAFPRTAWLRAERAVFGRLSPTDLGYADPRGTPALRHAVATWLARFRGIRVDPAEVVIVAGVSQALGLVTQVLRQDGITAIAVEDPGSLGARQHLRNWRVQTPPVPVDGAGLRVDALSATGVGAVMLTPAHQFPTGVVLDGDRRRQLIRWGGLVIEDDYDAEHRYDRAPVPALWSMMPEQVCYAGSVSKLLAPALRLGWLLAPARYRDALVAAKRNADLGNATLPQLVLAELMSTGDLERQLRFLRRRHVQRRDAMIDAIRTHLPGATVHGAAAGLHLMVTFDADFSDTELAAAAFGRGVKVQPLSWHRQLPSRPGLVLGYAGNTPGDLLGGVAALGAVLREFC